MVAALRAAGCVFAEEEAALLVEAGQSARHLDLLIERRVAGEPLEHLLGWVAFDGARYVVAPGVFVPRQRTTLMVVEAAASARPGQRVVELCCGVAAVAGALAVRVPGLDLLAADLDPAAVDCAAANLAPHGGTALLGDLYDPLPPLWRGRVDLLLANAPYVPTASIALMPSEARDHEPARALDGGPDGLDIQRRIIALAPDWLAPGGRLLIESSAAQAPTTADLMRANGLTARIAEDAELDATVVIGTAAR